VSEFNPQPVPTWEQIYAQLTPAERLEILLRLLQRVTAQQTPPAAQR
jgi:hypothetical protein